MSPFFNTLALAIVFGATLCVALPVGPVQILDVAEKELAEVIRQEFQSFESSVTAEASAEAEVFLSVTAEPTISSFSSVVTATAAPEVAAVTAEPIVGEFAGVSPDPVLPGTSMVIMEAGAFGKIGPELVDGLVFCPDTFSDRGFSIMCIADGATAATFSVNGAFERAEKFAPFFIAGDFRGRVFPYVDAPIEATIECSPLGGDSLTVSVKFMCDI